jgi:hypothetical protein
LDVSATYALPELSIQIPIGAFSLATEPVPSTKPVVPFPARMVALRKFAQGPGVMDGLAEAVGRDEAVCECE